MKVGEGGRRRGNRRASWRLREAPFTRDALNTLLAPLAICGLYVGTLYLILHRYGVAFTCFGTTLAMSVVLFFTWYRNLPAPERALAEEESTAP